MEHVVVTGGNRGIGLGFVYQYLEAGCEVTTTYRDESTLGNLQEISEGVEISLKALQEKYPGRLSLYQLDVTDEAGILQFASTIKKIDVLISNAGIKGYSIASTEWRDHCALHVVRDHTSDQFLRSFEVNTLALQRLMNAFWPLLSTTSNACAVYVSSGVGQTAGNDNGGYAPYRVAKAGSNMLITDCSIEFMRDWKKQKRPLHETPCAVAICPGWVRTDMGGPTARLSIEESTSGMKKVIDEVRATKKSNGLYMYDGEVVEQYIPSEVLREVFQAMESCR